MEYVRRLVFTVLGAVSCFQLHSLLRLGTVWRVGKQCDVVSHVRYLNDAFFLIDQDQICASFRRTCPFKNSHNAKLFGGVDLLINKKLQFCKLPELYHLDHSVECVTGKLESKILKLMRI